MKILLITKDLEYNYILFDNGYKLMTNHDQDCCENNYADFNQLDNTGIWSEEFDEDLIIDTIDDEGFRIRAKSGYWYFVPCYSEQNGYYSNDLIVSLVDNNDLIIKSYVLNCKECID